MVLASTIREAIPSEWTEQNTSSANAAVTVDHAAESGFRHVVTWIAVSYDGAPTGTQTAITLQEDPGGGNTTKFHMYYPSGGQTNPDPLYIRFGRNPVLIGDGLAVRFQIGAGGTGVQTKICFGGYTVPVGLRV